MKLWISGVRPAPAGAGYIWCKSVGEVEDAILAYEQYIDGSLDELDFEWLDYIGVNDTGTIELIDVHNVNDYTCLLNWLEATGRNYPICIHLQNPVGVENMRRIIERNGRKEIR